MMIRVQQGLVAAAAVGLVAFVAFLPDTSVYDLDPGAADRAWWLRVLLGFAAGSIGAAVAFAGALVGSSIAAGIAAALALVFGATFVGQAALVDSPLPLLSLAAILLTPVVFLVGRLAFPSSTSRRLSTSAPLIAGAGLALAFALLLATETGAVLRADAGLLGLAFVAAGGALHVKERPMAGSLWFAALALLILLGAVLPTRAPVATIAALGVMYVLVAAGMGWFLRAANSSRTALMIVCALPVTNAIVFYQPARDTLADTIASQAAAIAVFPQPLLPDYLDQLPIGSIVIAGFGGETAGQLAKVETSPFTNASGSSWSAPPAPFYALVGVVRFGGIDDPFERNASLAVDLRVDAGDPIGRTSIISPVPIRVLSDGAGVLIDVGRRWIVRTENGVGLVILSPAGDVVAVHRLEPRAPFVVPPGTSEPIVSIGDRQ